MSKKAFWNQSFILSINRSGYLALDPSADDVRRLYDYRELRAQVLRVLNDGPHTASAIVNRLIEDTFLPPIPQITRDDQAHALDVADEAILAILRELTKSGRVVGIEKNHRPIQRSIFSLGTALDRLSRV